MFIVDITSIVKQQRDDINIYCCNNSLLHFKDDIYLITYRRIEYIIPSGRKIHPWKMWDNGYKFLMSDPDGPPSKELHGRYKYRSKLSHDVFICPSSNRNRVPTNKKEFDSTGLMVARYKPDSNIKWEVLMNINNLFGEDMVQDARLYKDRMGDIFITYNAFVNGDTPKTIMAYRKLSIGPEFRYFYFNKEKPLLSHPHKVVEKNCVMHHDDIIYSIHKGIFIVHRPSYVHEYRSDLLQSIEKQMNPQTVLLSLGSSPIPYKGKYIAVGHVKVRHDIAESTFAEFSKSTKWSEIYKHGKFVY
ncbi:MAG: hypothetical protein EBV19_08085, partial [Flavobacteriia bacterium]|nr:hypothetical protein [Flavobacteriia bacterium]